MQVVWIYVSICGGGARRDGEQPCGPRKMSGEQASGLCDCDLGLEWTGMKFMGERFLFVYRIMNWGRKYSTKRTYNMYPEKTLTI